MVEVRMFWNDVFRLEPIPEYKPMKCQWCKSFLERVVSINVRGKPKLLGRCSDCNAPLDLNDYVDMSENDTNKERWVCRRCYDEMDFMTFEEKVVNEVLLNVFGYDVSWELEKLDLENDKERMMLNSTRYFDGSKFVIEHTLYGDDEGYFNIRIIPPTKLEVTT